MFGRHVDDIQGKEQLNWRKGQEEKTIFFNKAGEPFSGAQLAVNKNRRRKEKEKIQS